MTMLLDRSASRPLFALIGVGLLAVLLWGWLFREALALAVHTWYVSEIFSHGFFILPGVLYLIWRERRSLDYRALQPDHRVLLLLVPVLGLGLFGIAGGIQVFA